MVRANSIDETGEQSGDFVAPDHSSVLAALAEENGAWLASTDQDFRRFPGLRWINPSQ